MKTKEEVKKPSGTEHIETAAESTSHREKDWNADRQELSPTSDKPDHFDQDEVMHADPTANNSPESMGGEKQRTTVKDKLAERHITSEPGFKVAERRHAHVAAHRAEKDKLFEKRK